MGALSDKEQAELARLLGKMSFPVSMDLFYAWCKACVTVAIEICVIRKVANEWQLLLTYREDAYYKGWHVPGSVYLPAERIEDTQRRVLSGEIGMSESAHLEFFGWFDQPKGTGVGESLRGSVISLSYVHELKESLRENQAARFFPLAAMPKDLILVQIPIIEALKVRLA